jgi:hypothetical protein
LDLEDFRHVSIERLIDEAREPYTVLRSAKR